MSAEQDTTKPVAAAAAPVAPAAEEKAPAPAPAPVEAPSADDKPTEEEKPAVETPLTKLAARLPEITKSVGHTEMWGVQLSDDVDAHVPTKVVLQKFLRANNNDAAAAEKQLVAALEWRKKMNPPALVDASYDEAKFGGLGYVTVHEDEAGKQTVITWNIYGAVKSFKTTFGNLDE
jgi:phosphatidylinositol transfer protein SFH5